MATGAAAELTRHLYRQVLDRRRDVLERLVHEDFRLAGTREHVDRDDWIRLMLDETDWAGIDVEHVSADTSLDDATIVSSRVRYAGRRSDEPLTGVWTVIDVWQRQGVDWLLLSRTTFPAR